jgi:dephospho-CoA kinase
MDSVIQKAVLIFFGPSVFQNNIIRAKLAEIVFNDQKKLNEIKSIVHLRFRAHFNVGVTAHLHQNPAL